jgi:hypothetical protein
MFNLIHAFLFGVKVEINPKGFTLGRNVVTEKIFSICYDIFLGHEL